MFNGFPSRASCVRYLESKGFNISALLSDPESNPKVAKNGKLGILSAPLHLAPASLSGFNLCAQASAGCIAACLHTAGNPAYMAQKSLSRIAKSQAFMQERKAFMALLCFDIAALIRKADKLSMQPSIRLNATSDFPFESVKIDINGQIFNNVFEAFPNIEGYDYTKIEKRAIKWAKGELPRNYHLTFSKSEINDNAVDTVLKSGGNVAIVFKGKLPASYKGFNVINGDDTDFRPLDPKNVIVGLKAKGKAKSDLSGFVVNI